VLRQSPYGQWLYTEATSNIACLIFLSLDGAHYVQRVDTMTHPVHHHNNHLRAFNPDTVLRQGTATRMQPARPEVISIYYKVATQILNSSHALHEFSQPKPRLQA